MEGDLGMPAWVHRSTGFTELCLVSLRGYAVIADNAISETLTHIVTCGIMGGDLYTWHCAAQDPIGAVPATLRLCSSTAAVARRGADRRVHAAAVLAAGLGAASAAAIFSTFGRKYPST